MNRRSVLLILATLVAVIGAALVFVYVRSADNRANQQFETVEVLKATEIIEAGETIEAASSSGKLQLEPVPQNQVLDGALDSIDSLAGTVAVTRIYPGEQLVASKFGGQPEAEVLPIPKGLQAISIDLTDPSRVAGFVNPGSEVAIYHIQAEGDFFGEETAQQRVVLLLKRVQVLGVGSTSSVTKTVTADQGASTTEEVPKTLLTIAVTQEDAEKVMWSQKHGELALGLLTDDSATRYTRGTGRDNLYLF